MNAYPEHLSLRQIDEQQGWRKGTAFRAFKRLLLAQPLQEGRDFVQLTSSTAPTVIANYRAQGWMYTSSPSLLLIAQVQLPALHTAAANLGAEHG